MRYAECRSPRRARPAPGTRRRADVATRARTLESQCRPLCGVRLVVRRRWIDELIAPLVFAEYTTESHESGTRPDTGAPGEPKPGCGEGTRACPLERLTQGIGAPNYRNGSPHNDKA